MSTLLFKTLLMQPQFVFDHHDKVTDVVARWPGSTHDSRVLRESGLYGLMEGRILPAGDHYLLGDSGYPCKRWLLTPYLHPNNEHQEQYNRFDYFHLYSEMLSIS